MQNIIERVAYFADIDTRRAMGFPPRKIVLPDLNIPFEITERRWYIVIFLKKVSIYWFYYNETVEWVFDNFRCYSLSEDGIVTYRDHRDRNEVRKSRHPDFNEDGSLRAWQTYIH